MSDGLTTRERIDKEYEEIDGLVKEWKEEAAPVGEPIDPEPEPEKSVPEPPAEDPQLAVLREEKRKAEARYQTLQGMINKQNEELAALKAKVSEPAQPVINVEQKKENDDDYALLVEEYGEPAAKAMKNMNGKVLEAYKKELDAVREELKQTKETTGQLVTANAQTAEQRYYSELEKQVPNWKQINGSDPDGIPQDPKFTELLTQTVPFQDYTFNDLLQYHHSQGNVAKVAEIFKKVTSGEPEPPAPTKTANPLEKLIEPEKTGKGAAPPATNNKKTFTKAEVAKFDNDYMMYQSGRIKADPVKIEARWNEIQEALAEGRVR